MTKILKGLLISSLLAGVALPALPDIVSARAKASAKKTPKKVGGRRVVRKSTKAPAKKSVSKKPLTKKPIAKKRITKKPISKKPISKKPISKKPISKKPVPKKIQGLTAVTKTHAIKTAKPVSTSKKINAEQQNLERLEREFAASKERQALARANRDRTEREARERQERLEREAQQIRDRGNRERAEREAQQARERANRERAHREARENLERLERETAEVLAQAQAWLERDRAQRESTRQTLDNANRERVQREARENLERLERESQQTRERANRGREERESLERERLEQLQAPMRAPAVQEVAQWLLQHPPILIAPHLLTLEQVHNCILDLQEMIAVNDNIEGLNLQSSLEILENLKSYRAAPDLPLVIAIIKRIEPKIKYWDAKPFFTLEDERKFGKDMKSCKNMITRVLDNPGIPAIAEIPQRLKLNPWMINNPYFDILNAKQNLQVNTGNLNIIPNEQALEDALTKIGDLFDRLVRENKITEVRLLDYEALSPSLKGAFQREGEGYTDIMAYINAQHPFNFVPIATKDNLIGLLGILNKTLPAQNRAIALTKLIWKKNENDVEVQVISDEKAARLLARLAIGGRHCTVRAENDTSWAIDFASNAALEESNEKLEIKAASLMRILKQNAINAMVMDEEASANLPPSQLVHLQALVEKRLRPFLSGAAHAPASDAFFTEYGQRPIAQIVSHFCAKFTQEFLEMEVANDATQGMSRVPTGIIRYNDIDDYLDRRSAHRGLDGIITEGEEDEDGHFPIHCSRDNARALLYGLGYLEADED